MHAKTQTQPEPNLIQSSQSNEERTDWQMSLGHMHEAIW